MPTSWNFNWKAYIFVLIENKKIGDSICIH